MRDTISGSVWSLLGALRRLFLRRMAAVLAADGVPDAPPRHFSAKGDAKGVFLASGILVHGDFGFFFAGF